MQDGPQGSLWVTSFFAFCELQCEDYGEVLLMYLSPIFPVLVQNNVILTDMFVLAQGKLARQWQKAYEVTQLLTI